MAKHTRPPIPITPGRPEIIDDEYERHATGHLFRLFEPLTGQWYVRVIHRRTAIDDAHAIRHLVDVLHPDAEKIVLVQDNLNTHKTASLYEAFPLDEARRLIDKWEIHDTPKHGSWLIMAEIELSVLGRQCLSRRIPDFDTLTTEVAAWEATRNTESVRVQWQFTTTEARVKLKRLYPVLKPVKSKSLDH